jgi:hypothetical protein
MSTTVLYPNYLIVQGLEGSKFRLKNTLCFVVFKINQTPGTAAHQQTAVPQGPCNKMNHYSLYGD